MAKNEKRSMLSALAQQINNANNTGEPKTPGIDAKPEDLIQDLETGLAQYIAAVYYGKGSGVNSFKQLKSLFSKKSVLIEQQQAPTSNNGKTLEKHYDAISENLSAIIEGIDTASFVALHAEDLLHEDIMATIEPLNAIKDTLTNSIEPLTQIWTETATNLAALSDAMSQPATIKFMVAAEGNTDPSAIAGLLDNLNVLDPDNVKKSVETLSTLNDINLDGFIDAIKGIDSLSNTQVDNTKLNSLIKTLNDVIGTKKSKKGLIGVIPNLNTFSTEMMKVAPQLKKSVTALHGFIKMLNSTSDIKVGGIDAMSSEIESLDGSIEKISKLLDKISEYDIEDKVNNVNSTLTSLQKLGTIDLSGAAAAVSGNNDNLKTIVDGVSTQTSALSEAKDKIDDSNISGDSFSAAFAAYGTAIMMSAATMLIGGAIMSKHNELIMASLKFGGTLALFIAETSLGLVLMALMSKHVDPEGLSAMARLVITASAVMMIGGLFMMIGDGKMAKYATMFGITLGQFLLYLTPAIAIMGLFLRSTGNAMESVGKFIVTASIVMSIGALFMMMGGGKFAKNAIAFGLVLGAFMTLILLPFALVGLLGSIALHAAEEINHLVITCSIIMSVGALFMMLGGGKFAVNAIAFGFILGAFIMSILMPFVILSKLGGWKQLIMISLLQKFIVTSTIILMVGALFVMIGNGKMAASAIAFTIILNAFILGVILPLMIFKHVSKHMLLALVELMALMIVSTVVLCVGAKLVNDGLALKALEFTALLGTFIFTITWVFKISAKNIQMAIAPAIALSILIVAATASLVVGAYTLEKYGWNAVAGAIVIATYVGIILGVATLITVKIGTINMAIESAIALSILMLAISGSLFIASHAVKNLTLGKFIAIVTYTVIMLLVATLLAASISVIAPATPAAMAMAGVFVALGIAFLMLDLAIKTDVAKNLDKMSKLLLGTIKVFLVLIGLTAIADLGTIAAVAIGVAFTALGVGFGILSLALMGDPEKKFMLLNEVLVVAGITFALLAVLSKPILIGSIAAVAMGAAFTVLGVGFGILNLALIGNPLEKFLKLNDILIAAGKAFTILGILSLPILVGSVAAVAMSAALSALGIAFGILNMAMSNNPDKDFEKLGVVIKQAEEAFTSLGKSFIKITFGSIAGGAMAMALQAISGAIDNVHKIFFDRDPLVSVEKLNNVINTLVNGNNDSVGVFTTLMESPIKIMLASKALNSINTVLIDTAIVIDYLAELTEKHGDTDSSKIGNLLNNFVASIAYIPNGMLLKAYAKSFAVQRLGKAASIVAQGITPFASNSVPIEWDKDGVPTKFLTLDSDAMARAGSNAKTIITTLASAINEAYKDIKDINDVDEVLDVMYSMGSVVANIAEGMINYAELKIPTVWDDNGKAISFRPLTEKDFANCATGVKSIITNLKDVFKSLGQDKDFMRMVSDDDDVKNIIDVTTALGTVIKNISEGLISYAELKIPVEWDDNGKAISFRAFTSADFEAAKTNISTIVTGLFDIMTSIYKDNKNMFSTSWFSGDDSSPIVRVMEATKNVGDVVSKISEGISNYANMLVPAEDAEWVNGKPSKMRMLTDAEFRGAAENIGVIIKSTLSALKEGYDSVKDEKLLDTLPKIMGVMKDTGDVIGSYVDNIIKIGQSVVPDVNSEYDVKTGKFKKYKHIDMTKVTTDMGISLGIILTSLGATFAEIYNDHKEMFYDAKNPEEAPIIGKVISSFKDIGDVLSGIINAVQAYAELKMPIAWDKNGKPTKFKSIDLDTVLPAMQENLSEIITAVSIGIIKAVYVDEEGNTLKPIFNTESGDSPIKVAMDALQNVNKFVKNIFDVVTNYANLKIPNGFDKNGKATGYSALDSATIPTVQTNIEQIITAIATGVANGADEFNKQLGNVAVEDINTKMSHISTLIKTIGNALTAYSKLQLVELDKSGKVKNTINITESSLGIKMDDNGNVTPVYGSNSVVSNMVMLMSAIPIAVAKGYENSKEYVDAINANGKEYNDVYTIINNTMSGLIGTLKLLNKVSKGISEIGSIEDIVVLENDDPKSGILKGCIDLMTGFAKVYSSYNMLGATIAASINSFDESTAYVQQAASGMVVIVDNIKMLKDSMNYGSDANTFVNKFNTYIDATYNGSQYIADTISKITHIKFANALLLNLVINHITSQAEALRNVAASVLNTYKYMQITANAISRIDIKQIQPTILNGVNNLLGEAGFISEINNTISQNIKNTNTITKGLVDDLSESTKLMVSELTMIANALNGASKATSFIRRVEDNINADIWKSAITKFNDVLTEAQNIGLDTNAKAANTVNLLKNSITKISSVSSITFGMIGVSKNMAAASQIGKSVEPETFSNISQAITNVSDAFDAITKRSLENAKKETTELGKFVKHISSIQVQKVNSLTKLIAEMNKLSKNVGSLDKFANVLANRIAVTLDGLASEIKNSERVIKRAEDMQNAREKHIKDSIKSVQDLMNKPFNVVVSRNEAGKTVSANFPGNNNPGGTTKLSQEPDKNINNETNTPKGSTRKTNR